MYSHGFTNNRAAVALFQETERACDKQRTTGITVGFIKAKLPSHVIRMIFRYLRNLPPSVTVFANLQLPRTIYSVQHVLTFTIMTFRTFATTTMHFATHDDGMTVGDLSGSLYPLSYRVSVRERYGSTLLPATREQHDQNCTQSH